MALRQRLELRQTHALFMTPQLQQAVKLLTLSNLQVAEYVEEQIETNPLLERDEREDAVEVDQSEQTLSASDAPLEMTLAQVDFSKADELDADRNDLYPDDANSAPIPRDMPFSDPVNARATPINGEDTLNDNLVQAPNLKDHLLEQLSIAALNPEQRLIAAALIDGIDESGYLRSPIAEISAHLGTSESAVELVLQVVQGLEPTGVGARDVAECLALQLRERGRLDPAMQTFLEHLDLVARRDISRLCVVCGVDAEDIADMITELRTLTPKPGLSFAREPVQPVVPDVFVRRAADGSWHVDLNSDTLPSLLVNQHYYAKVAAAINDRAANEYLTECLNSATWLVKTLDQRARTILKVASEIVRQQHGFLSHGVRHLRPLNLQTIADATGMHESTVSRVTSNKYISTPRGILHMKYFFTAGISGSEGPAAHSAEAVRDRIREIIQRETPSNVLSDDRIVMLLTADGVNVARRTVAKYREAMRIPSSTNRRKVKLGEVSVGA